MLIDQTPFIVVDTETTGTSSRSDRLIEIAGVRVQGGEITDEFSTLINPGVIIPSRITRLTRITNGMVYGKPAASEVLPVFLSFLDEGVLVAHNASFDIGFINAELTRAGQSPLDHTSLCTLRLARRTLKGLRSKGLTALAAFYGIPIRGRHRALGDALATAQVLLRLIDHLKYERNLDRLDDLIRFQFTSYAPGKGARRKLVELRDRCLPGIPKKPGIYLFKGKSGRVLYVGKAKNLQARVRSYFTSIEAHQKHTRKLVEHVEAVDWRCTDSELEALIEESRLIKELKPRFNRAQKHYRNRPFIRLSVAEAFPAVSLTSYLVDDGAEYFGPMGSTREGNLVIDLINRWYLLRECGDGTFDKKRPCLYLDIQRCTAPCVCKETDQAYAYASEVDRVRQFLVGASADAILERLHEEMAGASALMEYEQAAVLRDLIDMVVRLMERQQCIAAPVLDHNAVVLDRSIDDDIVRFLFIRYGRLVDTLSSPVSVEAPFRKVLSARLISCFSSDENRPSRYLKAEIEEVRLLAHWLFVHRSEAIKVDYLPEMDLRAFEREIWKNF